MNVNVNKAEQLLVADK